MSGYELSQYLEIWIDRSGFVSYNGFEQNIKCIDWIGFTINF